MDTIYLMIKIKKSDELAENLRSRGLFFDCIAENLNIDKEGNKH